MSLRSFSAVFLIPAMMFLTATAAASASEKNAASFMDRVANQALEVITSKNLSKEQKQTGLERIFSSNVDIPWVGRFVMGRYWREASDQQKARYLKKYERFLIKHYTSRFADYTSGTFAITGSRQEEDGEYVVSMELKDDRPGEPPVLVDYRLRREDSGFRIFDVIVEGVSLITTQRSEFAAVISDHGIDYLIDKLDSMSVPEPQNGK